MTRAVSEFPPRGAGPADPCAVQALVARSTARHALGWLFAANLVGAGLSWLLLGPEWNAWIAPLTYGRWMPVHLNGQLYGWCSVPLIGLLFFACFERRHPHAVAHARIALTAWSLALAGGCVSWLAGVTSGKLFMDWAGWARPLLPLAMIVLWTLLAAHAAWRWRRDDAGGRGANLARAALLLALLPVPSLFFWAADPSVYPPVNPDSGGATGASLLGSTLGIVSLFGALPYLLRLPRGEPRRRAEGQAVARTPAATGSWLFGAVLMVSWMVYAAMDHGDASHRARDQIIGLGTLLIWIPLAWYHLAGFDWPPQARRWLWSAYLTWVLLVITGWVTFMPGWSESLKFTHGLVAHAHLAMAGLVTAVNHAVLICLRPGRLNSTQTQDSRWAFGVWHGGLAVQLASLAALTRLEQDDAAALFLSSSGADALLAIRALSGLAMLAASFSWLRHSWKS